MATPSVFEQLSLELINQARLNPHGEFDRLVNGDSDIKFALDFFGVNLPLLKQQLNALKAVAPIAWNPLLGDSAQGHTDLMAARDEQKHVLDGESDTDQRIVNTGYKPMNFGENIFASAKSAAHAHAAFMVEWDFVPNGIKTDTGHRDSIMSSTFTEVGVGHTIDSGGAIGPNVVTQDFGVRSDYTSQITGVIFNDADGDRFYDIGEGVGGTTISAASGSTTNWSSGGYNLDLASGTHTLTFSGPLGTDKIKVDLGSENIKIDLFDAGSFRSSVSATLVSGSALELLGEKNINATGNTGGDLLIGNSGNNILDGKSGADEMRGGLGNDTYIVDNTKDKVAELSGSGTDTVKASVSYTLVSFVENLVLTGSSDINGAGNGFGNRITGNSGDNILNGKDGNDILTGGGGHDLFRFDTKLGSGNVDTITDFTINEDKIQLDDAIFKAVGSSLTSSEFVANASGTAQSSLQHIIYDTTDGHLYYDADGSGAQARVHFASLSGGLPLDHLDFLVI